MKPDMTTKNENWKSHPLWILELPFEKDLTKGMQVGPDGTQWFLGSCGGHDYAWINYNKWLERQFSNPPSTIYSSTIAQVAEFHRAFGHPIHDQPNLLSSETNRLRVRLLYEEVEELEQALAAGDAVEVLGALTDIQYVLDGAYLALGFHRYKDAAFAEVQKSNLSKLDENGKPVPHPTVPGKIGKSSRYQEPDLESVLNG